MVRFTVTISLAKNVYEEIVELADRMRMSKGQVLEMAAEEFVQNHKGRKPVESSETEYEDLSEIENEAVETRSHSVGSKLLVS
jgi:adenine-specific DNA glycosylase